MKKNNITLSFLFLTTISYSQVGINTNNPNTTLDVSAKRDDIGNILDNSKTLGIQAPRVTLAELSLNTGIYNNNQKGALIYITDVINGDKTGQRVNISTIGYYYFDGNKWQKISTSIDEPWYIQNSTNSSNSNNDNIYQNGNVAIKKLNSIKNVDLDVLGSLRAAGSGRLLTESVTNPDIAGKNSVGLGIHSEAQGENSISIGNTAISNGNESISIGFHTQAIAQQEIVLGKYNAITNGNSNDSSIQTDPLIQIGNGTGTGSNSSNAMTILKNGQIGINISGQNDNAKPHPSAILDVQSTNKGFLPPRVTLTNSTMQLGTSPNALALWVYNIGGTNNLPSGYYFWNGSVWTSFEVVTSTSPAIASLQCNSAYLNPSTYAAYCF
ncbi:hypothetical protein HXZ94_01980 [Empedobacter falsenii]|uniref:hypothetical protein n=1 Tax=Empedobacter falsenii TaxID=343874 RepID=UPI0025766070|nr:hypothetical protein [Empedobacter falsenii]MDM1297277.1 hypothetical protein [Empedobacter falsenii]MDM1317070.1 hypothetical protein [Empedobacter falsenii]